MGQQNRLKASTAVEMWCSYILKANIRQKLPCVYLANDLIQKAKLINKRKRALMEGGYSADTDFYYQFHLKICPTFLKLFR